MSFEEIENSYVSVPEIANATGAEQVVVHRWIRYFRYMDAEYLKGKPLVKRADFEKFKTEHPELIRVPESKLKELKVEAPVLVIEPRVQMKRKPVVRKAA